MSRTITALFDSRADAETARARLIAGIRTESTRIIAKDTVAAVDTLQFEPDQTRTYREAIGSGSHLLVAEVEAGQDPKRIVSLLEHTGGAEPVGEAQPEEIPSYGFVGVTDEAPAEPVVETPASPSRSLKSKRWSAKRRPQHPSLPSRSSRRRPRARKTSCGSARRARHAAAHGSARLSAKRRPRSRSRSAKSMSTSSTARRSGG